MDRMLSGIKPSGKLTLGNYIGAIRNFIKYQDEYEMYVFIANLHAITVHQDKKELKQNIKDIAALYIACGLDPEKVTLFIQTDVLEHAQLGFILNCNSYMGELSRMTQFKDKSQKLANESITVGLFSYPCLMAADILLYDCKYIPVGDDQKQHVELTRDIANRMNNKYGNLFTVPEPIMNKVGSRVMSLSNPLKKMSKSDDPNDKGCIYLLDDLNVARKKIMSAVTDSDMLVKYDEENKPGISNLIEIYCALKNISIEECEEEFVGANYGTFKKAVADVVCATLEEIQAKYHEVINSGKLEEIFTEGANKARMIARKKLFKVQSKIGLM